MNRLFDGLGGEEGAMGPFAPYIWLIVGLLISGIVVSAGAFAAGIIRDQSSTASVLDNAANSAARQVGVRALASGAAVLNTTAANSEFSAFLTAHAGLRAQGTGTYVPVSPTSLQSLTAPESVQVGSGGGQTVTTTGQANVTFLLPFIGTVQVGLPESVAVEPRAVIARVAGP